MKKAIKKSLSVLLALVIVVTTFFIFDPSVLKIDSDAFVNVDGNTNSSLSKQTAYAPETVWLTPGSTTFQYFANFNSNTGTVTSAVDTTGTVSFSNSDASEVRIGVNKIYAKDGSSFSGKLRKGSTDYTPANKTATNATDSTSFSNVANGGSSASVTLNNTFSLTNAAEGKLYFIEWIVRYVIGGTAHFTYMYTGVYAPLLKQAGVSYFMKDERPEQSGYSFITGAYAIGGGNAASKYTSTSVSSSNTTAPLIGFKGDYGDSYNTSTKTINGGKNRYLAGTAGDRDFTSGNGGGVLAVPDWNQDDDENLIYSTFTSTGSVTNPNPTGTTLRTFQGGHDGEWTYNQTVGVAYTVVDTSRFTNYNQIPNLSAGWVQYAHYRDGNRNCIRGINGYNMNRTSVLTDPINCNVDSGDYETGDDCVNSFTRGLYKINGNVRSGLVTLDFDISNGYKSLVNTFSIYMHLVVGLNTQAIDKKSLRDTYNKALNSNIDYVYCSAASQNYTNYYNQLKATGEALCNPMEFTTSANATLESYVRSYKTAIAEKMDASVYFYVPEVIYLKPSTAGTTSVVDFQYYADRANADNGALTSDVASSTTGNIYFNCTQAKSFKIEVSKPTGCNVTASGYTLGSWINLSSGYTTMTGSAYNTNNQILTWTATWKDANGNEFTATRKTAIYKQNYTAYGGAAKRTSGYGLGKTSYTQGVFYLTGFSSSSSYTSGSYKIKDVYNPMFYPSWTASPNNTGIGGFALDSNSGGPVAWGDGASGTTTHTIGSASSSGLSIYIDKSRYTNYKYIPFLYWNVIVSDLENTNSDR